MEDDTTSLCAALFGLAGFEVLAAADAGGELELLVQTTVDLVGCPSCGAVARAKDRRPSWVRDLPIGGRRGCSTSSRAAPAPCWPAGSPPGHRRGGLRWPQRRWTRSAATSTQLPDAVRVLDPFHVVRLGLACVADVRRRDLMDLYQLDDPDQARAPAEQLISDLRDCPIPELARLGRTLHAWRVELWARFDHPAVSNGPTENLSLKIKNTKRAARGYRKFAHYRLRLLLNHGRIHEDHSPARIRTRTPRFAA